jgi:glutamine synthetase
MFGYSLLRAGQNQPFFKALMEEMPRFGIPIEGLHTETGPGVYEAAILYSEALEAADRAALFKTGAKEIGQRFGIMPSFMAKWNAQYPGCSGHVHQSLWDGKRNVFHDAKSPRRMSKLFESYLAGQLHCLQDIQVFFAPTVNSYKRLVRQGAMSYFSWAPVFNSYGSNNRTNSVRVPAGGGRCESRNADGAVNPYLAATLALAAGLEGIRDKLDPGKPNEDNLYAISEAERRERGIDFLPQTLEEAVAAFAADPLVERTLGRELRDEFIKYKTEEWQAYHLTVSDWEIERYSHMF